MKTFTLFTGFFLLTPFAFSQNCARVVSGTDIITNSQNNYTLTVNWNADGQKHIEVLIYSGTTVIHTDCIDINCGANCSGTWNYSFTNAGNPPSATLTPFTGTCNHGTQCVPATVVCPSCGPLPLSLSSFLVGRTGLSISLKWKMEAGINVSNFEVERSFDNASYKAIATVAGNGNNPQSYSYTDNTNNSKLVSFYRLKIIKQSGEVDYSDIKTVKGFGGKAGFVLFPNPSFGNARITITDINEPTNVQVLDNSGRMIKSLLLNNSNTVEIKGLQKGTYMVRITGTGSGITTVKKLTVIN